MYFQELILKLQQYWSEKGCILLQPYDIEVAKIRIGDKKTYLVFGQIIQLPFGTLSKDIKIQLGEELTSLFN